MTVRGTAVLLLASFVGLGVGAAGGCGSKDDPPAPPPPVTVDAAPLPVTPPAPGITELPAYDPASGAHLDGKERETPPANPTRPRNRNARIIGIMLRSSPPGAIAAVDGQPIGPTPTYWEGEFTGSEREFTFALAKHAVARYRFIPTTSGVVHGRLEPIAVRPGAGTPAIPLPAYPALAPRVPLGATAPEQGGATGQGNSTGAEAGGGAPVTTPDRAGSPTANPVQLDGGAGPQAAPVGSDARAGEAAVAPSAPSPAPSPTSAPVAPAVEPVAPNQ